MSTQSPHNSLNPYPFTAPRIVEVGTSLQPAAHTNPPTPEPPPRRTVQRRWLLPAVAGVLAVAGVVNLGLRELRGSEPLAPQVVSGKAGLKQATSGKFQRWRKQKVDVLIDSSVDTLGAGTRDAIRGAFESWDSAGITLPEVRFRNTSGVKLSAKPDGVSTVIYAPIDIPGHTNDLAVTIAFSDPVSGEIVEADVVINSRHEFAALQNSDDDRDDDRDDDGRKQPRTEETAESGKHAGRCVTSSDGSQCGRKYDIQNVMTHEAGHFYGLAEDVHEPSATMYECISACETRKRALSLEDQDAVTELYADGFDAETEPEAAGCGAHITPTVHAGAGSVVASVLSVLGVAALRRRRRGR
ncbi:MAG TPA: matrixin family metalloprotease [Polyangiaceae bacterium]